MENEPVKEINKKTEDYIYNKATIGGIDDSNNKPEFEETLKPKIYINKPNRGSWIVLGVLIVIAIAGGGYYIWKTKHIQLPHGAAPVANPDSTAPQTEDLKAQLLKLSYPQELDQDAVISILKADTIKLNQSNLENILTSTTMDSITAELKTLFEILPHDAAAAPAEEKKPADALPDAETNTAKTVTQTASPTVTPTPTPVKQVTVTPEPGAPTP